MCIRDRAISKAMTESGLQAKFINGMRVTDDETIKIVEETLARVINPEIVTKINACLLYTSRCV